MTNREPDGAAKRVLTPLRVVRLVLLFIWTLCLLPVLVVALSLGLPAARTIPLHYHRGVARVLRLAIDTDGVPSRPGPVLFVANHSSWLDIVVLSALAPVSFVAKSEIAHWPGVSIFARLQRTVFVVRHRRQTATSRSAIGARLAAGDNIVLFAEGTAADGNRVLPFKTSLFAAAEGGDFSPSPLIQPVSIAYTHLNHMPLGRRARHHVAWYGRMSLGKHLWHLLGQGEVRIAVTIHPAVRISDFASRKELGAHCHRLVAASHAEAISGRRLLASKVQPVVPTPSRQCS